MILLYSGREDDVAGLVARRAMLVLELGIEVAFDVVDAPQIFSDLLVFFIECALFAGQLEVFVTSETNFIFAFSAAKRALILFVQAFVARNIKSVFALLTLFLVEFVALYTKLDLVETLMEILLVRIGVDRRNGHTGGGLELLLRTVQTNAVSLIPVLTGVVALAGRIAFAFN